MTHPMLKNTSKSSKIVKYSPSENARQYLLHASSVGLCAYEKETELTQKEPADHFMGVVLDGKAYCAAGSDIETAAENELIVFRADKARSFKFEHGTVLLWIDFNGPSAPGYFHILEEQNVHVFRGDAARDILPVLREMLTPTDQTNASEVETALFLTTALARLCTVRADEHEECEEAVMNRILHSIVSDIVNPPSVKEMAETAGYSQAHFIRVFTRQTGMTPHQYVISIRIDRAKHLLSTTQLPMRTIAAMVGYTSESMFCSSFRKAVNITAKEYRSIAAHSAADEVSETLRTIHDAVIAGNSADIARLCRSAVNTGHTVRSILDTMMTGMEKVEALFKNGDIQLSEMLQSAKALKKGLAALEPNIGADSSCGTAIIGTVAGDLHDVGKNLVALMMRSVGYRIIDLGVDVSADDFIAACRANPDARLILISALLLSSRPVMENTVSQLNKQPFRRDIKIIVGGGTIDEAFAQKIGADAYTSTATDAARTARQLMQGEEQHA